MRCSFKVSAVAKFLPGIDSLVLGLSLPVSLFADCLWKKPFSPLNVKVRACRPPHPSPRQKVRAKPAWNGQRQTQRKTECAGRGKRGRPSHSVDKQSAGQTLSIQLTSAPALRRSWLQIWITWFCHSPVTIWIGLIYSRGLQCTRVSWRTTFRVRMAENDIKQIICVTEWTPFDFGWTRWNSRQKIKRRM